MNLSHRIQAKTDNGDLVIDFLIEVMTDERPDFKICHRLDAAKLLTRYGRDEAIEFILDNPPESPRRRFGSRSSDMSAFDTTLAKKIRESTDDGASVVRFLINVMEGELKAFGPHHSMAAARELLSRGFGKHAREETRSSLINDPPLPQGEGRSLPRTRYGDEGKKHENQPTPQSQKSPNHTNHSSDNPTNETIPDDSNTNHQTEEDDDGWAALWEEMAPIIERDDRLKAELAEQELDPDNPPHVPDLSAFHEAWENTQKLYEEWKNSFSDPDELAAIMREEAAEFDAMVDRKVERRRQIDEDREHRAKEEAEREAQQAKARAEAQAKVESESEEPPDPGPPPTREEHEYVSATPKIPGSYVYRNCRHPKCRLHDKPRYYPEDDRSSPYYFNGRAPPMYGNYGL